jgi:hypothetical protein
MTQGIADIGYPLNVLDTSTLFQETGSKLGHWIADTYQAKNVRPAKPRVNPKSAPTPNDIRIHFVRLQTCRRNFAKRSESPFVSQTSVHCQMRECASAGSRSIPQNSPLVSHHLPTRPASHTQSPLYPLAEGAAHSPRRSRRQPCRAFPGGLNPEHYGSTFEAGPWLSALNISCCLLPLRGMGIAIPLQSETCNVANEKSQRERV